MKVRLGDVCIINPKAPKFDDALTVSFVPMPKVGENGEFDPSETKNYSEVKKGFTFFQNDDVLFAKITPCMENGKGAVARNLENGVGFGSTEFHVLRPYKDKVKSNWLFYLLSCDFFRKAAKASMTGAGGQQRVPKTFLEEYELFLPGPEVQTEQTKKLDLISDLISLRKHQLAKLDEIVKSRFAEMFGDVKTGLYKFQTRKLGEVADVGSSHRVFTTEFVDEGIPFYRGTEIGELANGIKPQNPYRITKEHYEKLASDETKPQIGDLLMPSICNKGQVWMVDTDEPFYYKDGRVLCISPNRNLFNCKYIEQFMREKTLVEYPKLGSGSTFAEFKIFLLKDIDVLIPPIELQNQFAAFVEQVDKSKLVIQQSLDKLETLKKALMQKYFG